MAEIRINETGTLKLFDADDSHSAGIAAGTITADATLMTLNTADIDISVPIDVTGASTITTADNTDTLTLKSTDTDDDIGPNLRLFRAVTGADNDSLGTIDLAGQDDGGNNTDYASIAGQIVDASNGSEDGKLTLKVMNAGSLNQMLTISGPETVINEGSKDHDFRVESDGDANAFFIEGSTSRVGIGTSSPTTALTVNGTITHIGGTSSSTSDLTQGGLHFHDSSTSAGDIMPITFTPSATADRARAGIGFISQAQDGAAGFAADIAFYTRGAADGSTLGTSDERMRIFSGGGVAISRTSALNPVSGGLTVAATGANTTPAMSVQANTQESSGSIIVFHKGTGGECGSIGMTNLNSGSAVSYNTSSDYRLKENVNYNFDATTRLKQLKPAVFNWIDDESNNLVDGFLAHEVSNIIPEAITGIKDETTTHKKAVLDSYNNIIAENIEKADWTEGKAADEDGNRKYPTDSTWHETKTVPKYQQIDQSKLVPLMVKTIQELEARIKTLEDA